MLIVNTTYQVAEACESDWKRWVLEEYAPEVTKTGMLVNPRFLRLLVENEEGFTSYALQFEVLDLETLEKWFSAYGTALQQTMGTRFNENVLGFTTLMETL
jgi:hypothetical protein